MAGEDLNKPHGHGQTVKLVLELAAGWILVSALAFVVGFCVVRLMGIKGGEASAPPQVAGHPKAPGTR